MYIRHEVVPVSSLRYVEQSILGVLNLSVDVELDGCTKFAKKGVCKLCIFIFILIYAIIIITCGLLDKAAEEKINSNRTLHD